MLIFLSSFESELHGIKQHAKGDSDPLAQPFTLPRACPTMHSKVFLNGGSLSVLGAALGPAFHISKPSLVGYQVPSD